MKRQRIGCMVLFLLLTACGVQTGQASSVSEEIEAGAEPVPARELLPGLDV